MSLTLKTIQIPLLAFFTALFVRRLSGSIPIPVNICKCNCSIYIPRIFMLYFCLRACVSCAPMCPIWILLLDKMQWNLKDFGSYMQGPGLIFRCMRCCYGVFSLFVYRLVGIPKGSLYLLVLIDSLCIYWKGEDVSPDICWLTTSHMEIGDTNERQRNRA